MNDRISVAIASYNGEKFLKEQLDSLYNQTIPPDEVVVCDDCSKDSTVDILKEYNQKYGLTYYVNERSLGVNKNFERALGLCNGDYIMICDQDDVWFDNKIEVSYNKIKSLEQTHGADTPIVFSCQNCKINDRGDITDDSCAMNEDSFGFDDVMFYPDHNAWQGCALMMNRELLLRLKNIPSSFTEYPYDLYITLFAAMTGAKYTSRLQLFAHRVHDHNVSINTSEKANALKQRLNEWYYIVNEYFSSSLYHLRAVNHIYQRYKPLITDGQTLRWVENAVNYYNGGLFARLRSVGNVHEFPCKRKIKQYFIAVLPLQLMRRIKGKGV